MARYVAHAQQRGRRAVRNACAGVMKSVFGEGHAHSHRLVRRGDAR